MSLRTLSPSRLEQLGADVRARYSELKAKNLNLDLTRGKPSTAQLDANNALLSLPSADDVHDSTGADVRNYGNLAGVLDIRQLWAEVLGIDSSTLIAADSSSLNIMFDLISWSYQFGNNDSPRPWKDEETVKWICPVPGYDRHFTISEQFGEEMIPVELGPDGPDMDRVEELVRDPAVKGMWAVPLFSNPTGVCYSREVARRLAAMETAAPDFRIVWDNAYAVHTLTSEFPDNPDVIAIAEEEGHPNRFWYMSSTSKVTFAGAGVSFFASSKENLTWYTQIAGVRGIGPNKVNQLAHARYFRDAEGVRELMRRHAETLAPKFAAVQEILQDRLGGYGVASWTEPRGGYFISLDVVDGTASRVWELAKDAGIMLTAAGASFPHGEDPNDRNIRLAPSLPPLTEVREAMDGVATCVLLAAVEKLEG